MKLAFDVGGTKIRLALVNDHGIIGDITRLDTDSSARGFAALCDHIADFVRGRNVTAAVGSLPGEINANGVLILAPNLLAWLGINVAQGLSSAAACPTRIYNDTWLCGIGEAWHGSGSQQGVMAYLTVSTGVNAVRLIDGMVDGSIPGYELGFQIVSGGPKFAPRLENMIGGHALQKRLGSAPRLIRDPKVWDQEAHYLARAILNMWLYWAPQVIVLGGSMMRDISIDAIEKHLASFQQPPGVKLVLKRSTMQDTAGLMGAQVILNHPA